VELSGGLFLKCCESEITVYFDTLYDIIKFNKNRVFAAHFFAQAESGGPKENSVKESRG